MSVIKILFIVLAGLVLSASIPEAESDSTPAQPSTALLLAQTCVAEIGFYRDTSECVLMWEINQRNAKYRGVSIRKQTKQFNAYWKNPNKQRPWIQHLNEELKKPEHWPNRAASWAVHRPIWKSYLSAARTFLHQVSTQTYRNICPRAADYGGKCGDGKHACDKPRMTCAKPLLCLSGRTFQAYWDLTHCRRSAKTK